MGGQIQPHEYPVRRWYLLLRYPEGVAKEVGERWFLASLAPEIMRQPGLFRFFSFRAVDRAIALPREWPAAARPSTETILHSWDRLVELWYPSFAEWRTAVIDSPPHYTALPWTSGERFPFLEPGKDFVSSFLLERPNDEFWRDSRGYV